MNPIHYGTMVSTCLFAVSHTVDAARRKLTWARRRPDSKHLFLCEEGSQEVTYGTELNVMFKHIHQTSILEMRAFFPQATRIDLVVP